MISQSGVKVFFLILLGEKMAAFSCWNENDSIPKRVIYGKMTCNKLYGTVICAMVERQPGEDICIRFNTEGRNEKSM